MFFSCDASEMQRQVHQILEQGSSKEEMIEGVRRLGGLWASARLRFRDLPGCELSAAWAKIVGTVCEAEIDSNRSWIHKLRKDSAGSGPILEVEEHIQVLEQVKLEKWLDIKLHL
jgi:hypothetical protein